MAFYQEDIVTLELNRGTVYRSFAGHALGGGDIAANRFGFRCVRNGVPVDLTGASIQGYFIRSNGTTVVISGGLASGDTAFITLPQSCYAIEGNFTLTIKLVGGDASGSMRIVDGTVVRTTTDEMIDPGTVVPDLSTILAIVDQLEGEIAEGREALDEFQLALASMTSRLKPYNMRGVNISNILNTAQPTAGGNLMRTIFLQGYTVGGDIQYGFDDNMMCFALIDIHELGRITVPLPDEPNVSCQYLIGTTGAQKGVCNVHYSDIGTENMPAWMTAGNGYTIIDCDELISDFPTCRYLFFSINNETSMEWLFDNYFVDLRSIPAFDPDHEKKMFGWENRTVRPYDIQGVSVENILNPAQPASGGNLMEGVYLKGYNASGIEYGFDDGMMCFAMIPISGLSFITIPNVASMAVSGQVQYVLVADSDQKGLYNIEAGELTDIPKWIRIGTEYSYIDCDWLKCEHPAAYYIFVSMNNVDTLKYVFDNKYTGGYKPYTGNTRKTISWLQNGGAAANGWAGKKLCTYGDSLFGQYYSLETPSPIIGLPTKIADKLGMTLYERSFSGSSVSTKMDAIVAWIKDSAVAAKDEVIVYRHNADDGGTPPAGCSAIQNFFYEQARVNTIPTDTDVVVIMGGINDVEFKGNSLVVVNDVTAGDESYFTYAYAKTIERIQARVPNAVIALAIEPYCTTIGTDGTKKAVWDKVVSAVKYLGEYYHLPVIDLYDESTFSALTAATLIKQDGTHPTTAGDTRLAQFICGGLMNFEPLN